MVVELSKEKSKSLIKDIQYTSVKTGISRLLISEWVMGHKLPHEQIQMKPALRSRPWGRPIPVATPDG